MSLALLQRKGLFSWYMISLDIFLRRFKAQISSHLLVRSIRIKFSCRIFSKERPPILPVSSCLAPRITRFWYERQGYPPDTEDKQKSLYGWFSTRGPSIGVERTPKILNDIEKLYGKKTWGAVGYCWGAKVIALTSGPDTPFSAAAHAHPGLIDTQNAERISIPTCMLASKDETAEEVTAWGRALKVEKHVETFDSQIHGWMSARADLEDEKVKSEYVRGYKLFLEFFAKYL